MDREGQIVRASLVNVAGNVALSAVKGAAGVATGSVAITLDAVNSLTDALGSIIAIVGTKLAGRSANRDHPFGFGRMEYVTSIAIAALILSAGVSSFVEAVRAIIHPTAPTYGFVSLAVVAIAALVKFALGAYLLKLGKKLGSSSLSGSGTDSFMDGGVSAATFAAGIVYLVFGLQVESLLAALIALLIIKSGVELLLSMTSKLLGERVSSEVASEVRDAAASVEGVGSVSGLALLDFGPDQVAGTIYVTVDGHMEVAAFDAVAREVRSRVQESCGVTLAGVMPYPEVVSDAEVELVREAAELIVRESDELCELRGFYADSTTHEVRLDVVCAFGAKDREALRAQVTEALSKALAGWTIDVRVVIDVAD